MRWASVAVAVAIGVLTLVPSAMAKDPVVSATGTAKLAGRSAVVEVLLVVPKGANAAVAKRRALAAQGARPAGGAELRSSFFTFNGLFWDDVLPVQYYNPSWEPVDGEDDVEATHDEWSNPEYSSYRISSGGRTDRCPSLVRECRGPQHFDDYSDVGWNGLSSDILGVTWYGTSIDEADISLNYRFDWTDGCVRSSGRYDAQTVLLHENGHVAGLDHSSDPNAVMYPSYQGVRCSLSDDDRAGIAALYGVTAD